MQNYKFSPFGNSFEIGNWDFDISYIHIYSNIN